MKKRAVAIVPAAGSGSRLGKSEKKPFVRLGGKPLIVHALRSLGSSGCIDSIIVAADASSINRMKKLVKKHRLSKIAAVTNGGPTRSDSVKNCFNLIKEPCDIVLIHDGARPFVSAKLIRDSVAAAQKYGACIAAIKQTDTVKLANKGLFVKKTLDRSGLWRAQTPQAFKYGILKNALSRPDRSLNETDEASAVERAGGKVKIIEGSAANIRITTKEDLKMAEVLLCAPPVQEL
jgi:2-C-methyl-D-erythritol 4-phosphate cytidylyltransferase